MKSSNPKPTSKLTTINPKPITKKDFRLQAMNLFLTYPQCTTTKEEALENLKRVFPSSLKGAIVAKEQHADGEPHLHILVYLSSKFKTRSTKQLDSICRKHGNYQAQKNTKKCFDYVTKEDTDFLTYGTIPSFKSSSRTSKSTIVADMILSGSSLQDVIKLDSGYCLSNLRKIREFKSYVSEMSHQESLQSVRLPLPLDGLTGLLIPIVEWLNTNLRQPRSFKQSQLYIYGPPSSGKTSLTEWITNHFSVYPIPSQEDFFDYFENNKFDLAVFDEFKGNKPITLLNEFLQGTRMCLKVKGSQYIKTHNIPVIILSNYSPADSYKGAILKDPIAIDSLLTRLLVITIPLGDNIFLPDDWKLRVETSSSSSSSTVNEERLQTVLPTEEVEIIEKEKATVAEFFDEVVSTEKDEEVEPYNSDMYDSEYSGDDSDDGFHSDGEW